MNSPIPDLSRRRPREIAALLPLGVLCGATVGVFTNAINGWLSPGYFVATLGWQHRSAFVLWVRSVAEGVLEGCALGALLGLILMLYIGFISRLRCPLKISAPALFDAIVVTLVFWLIGGFNVVLLALFAPEFYELFIGLPPIKSDAIRYAWVAGSLNSLGIGGLLAVCFACARFGARWKRETKAAENKNFDFSK